MEEGDDESRIDKPNYVSHHYKDRGAMILVDNLASYKSDQRDYRSSSQYHCHYFCSTWSLLS